MEFPWTPLFKHCRLQLKNSCCHRNQLSFFPCYTGVSSNEITSPQIIIGLQTVFVNLYQSVNLTCIASGNPQPSIAWYKDGRVITDEISPLLVIQEVELSDRGVYNCTAKNTLGTASSSAVININGTVPIAAYNSY